MDRSIVLDTTNKYTIADWVVVKEIGVGNSSSVKMVYDPARNTFAALKVLSKAASRRDKLAFENEANLLRKMNHPNLINIIDSYIDIDYEDEQGKTSQLTALALELASNGELYEFLAKTGRFDEKIARLYFRQLINALDYCHKKGIAHRDIKPENILLDAEYNLKIADFGLARFLSDTRRNALVGTIGSEGYAAPELMTQGVSDGRKVDIFAAGVVLFLILAGNPPFARADYKDPCYRLLCSGKENVFWEQQEARIVKENNENVIFSKELKELLNAMLAIDPEDRPSIDEIKANAWFNGPVATQDELKSELERRSVIVQSLLNQVVLNKQDVPSHSQNTSEYSKPRITPPQPIQTSNLTTMNQNSVPVLTNNTVHEEAPKDAREASILNLLSPSLPNISLN